jgi:hypothetical protein
MKVWADASPYQVAVMARVLGTFCKQHGIANQPDRDKIAERIVALYESGVTREDELFAKLKRTIN